ncbi:unnamed protein product [Brassicogethes aeneus]|uniref:Tachykinin n=1 Tax=Brassicogethes aeneus TaxID=1431903 RepID=A0A9P0BJ88_BRAAE|nr:unnamed protein product [Brassicogethes aeneus]
MFKIKRKIMQGPAVIFLKLYVNFWKVLAPYYYLVVPFLQSVNSSGEYAKRAPSGFFGMRGKKQYLDYYNDKRAPMGFVGMRGKKSVEDVGDVAFGEEKRAPQGFFGMRGKKLQGAQGFFGMRGKKYPYEFRGKFVGVRGKKYINEDLILNREYPRLDMNNLLLLLTENNNGETKLKPNVGEENQMEN